MCTNRLSRVRACARIYLYIRSVLDLITASPRIVNFYHFITQFYANGMYVYVGWYVWCMRCFHYYISWKLDIHSLAWKFWTLSERKLIHFQIHMNGEYLLKPQF